MAAPVHYGYYILLRVYNIDSSDHDCVHECVNASFKFKWAMAHLNLKEAFIYLNFQLSEYTWVWVPLLSNYA